MSMILFEDFGSDDPSDEEICSSGSTTDSENDDESYMSEQTQLTAAVSASYEQKKQDDNLTVVDLLNSIDDVVEAVLDIFVPGETTNPITDEETKTHRKFIPLKKPSQKQLETSVKTVKQQSNRSICTEVDNTPPQTVTSPLMYAQQLGNHTANWISSKGSQIEAEAGKINWPVPVFGINSPTNQSPSKVSGKQDNSSIKKEEKPKFEKASWPVSSFGLGSSPQEEVQVNNERKKRWFQRRKASSAKNYRDNAGIDDDKSETDFWDTVLDIVSPESKEAEEELKIEKKKSKVFRRSKRKNGKSNDHTISDDRDDISNERLSMKSLFGGTRV
jgi:hypothetical protein